MYLCVCLFVCLFFMENQTKMSINKLLLLFAVLITFSCLLNPPSVFHNYVLVWWKMWVNEALWMILYWTLGDFETRLSPGPPLCTSCLQHSSVHAHSPPSHHSQNTRVESHTKEKTLTWRAVSMASDCVNTDSTSDIFRSFWFVLFWSSASWPWLDPSLLFSLTPSIPAPIRERSRREGETGFDWWSDLSAAVANL